MAIPLGLSVVEQLGTWAIPNSMQSWLAVGLALAASFGAMLLVRRNVQTLFRPAFAVALVVNILLQWPMALAANSVEEVMINPLMPIYSPAVVVFALIAWVTFTPLMTRTQPVAGEFVVPQSVVLVFMGLTGILLAAYLASVPLSCTGLWAFLVEPRMSQLAREVSVKMVSSSLSTYALGALTNVVLPITAALCLNRLIFSLRHHMRVSVVAYSLALLTAVALVLVPGIKGLLIPTGLMLACCGWFWARGPLRKVAATGSIALLLVLMIVGFDTLKERNSRLGTYYFMTCASAVGSQSTGMEMLRSVATAGGFGLTRQEISTIISMGHLSGEGDVTTDVQSTSDGETAHGVTPVQTLRIDRFIDYGFGVARRAFIVPGQVAVLHFKFVEDEGSPGLKALPFAAPIIGDSVDVGSLVFQRYIAPTSETNRDSSGTAPTTFLMTGPAYFGVAGLVGVILLILAFDGIFAFALKRAPEWGIPLLSGIVLVLVFNSLTSDLAPLLLSHGGLAATTFALWLMVARSTMGAR